MTDITNTHLEAAIIDQIVAGNFAPKQYAFVAVPDGDAYVLGVAIKHEPGYNPIPGKRFDDYKSAAEWAEGLNEHIGLDKLDAMNIIMSTMFQGNRKGR